MFKITYFDDLITNNLVAADKARQATHTPSGKLSASMLGEPLQWQILKTLGIGTRVIEPYVLRKFARGRDTEAWYITQIGDAVKEKQKLVEYRQAIGYIDAMVEIVQSKTKQAVVLPIEIKSISNAKYKQVMLRKQPDENHLLQSAFYAMAVGSDNFALTYIATDDYRTLTWVFKTKDYAPKIDKIIDTYQAQLAKKEVPIFVANYKWQENLTYNKFPEWLALNAKEIKMAMDKFYPNAWENLK